MDEKQQLKLIRSRMNSVGLTMLAYYGIMNVAVTMVMLLDMAIYCFTHARTWSMDEMLGRIPQFATSNGWGYILAIVVGGIIVLLWKKPNFWKYAICAKEKPMTAGSFFQLLCVFVSAQAILQLFATVLEWLLNLLGLSILESMEAASISSDSFSMFLYITILAPVTEELLFRGLILRTLQPYGKRFAIFASAVVFGLLHGNVIQIPFAFLTGLVLGYVTMEYSLVWAIALHMFNNLVLSDLMGRLTDLLPEGVGDLIFLAVITLAAIAAAVILLVRRKDLKAYFRENPKDKLTVKGFLTAPCVVIFGVMMLLSSLLLITTK